MAPPARWCGRSWCSRSSSSRLSCSRATSRVRCASSRCAVARVGRGELPAPLPESGLTHIVLRRTRGFNTMTANLHRMEQDRALLLAGALDDLRTPLARLRLGVEMSTPD